MNRESQPSLLRDGALEGAALTEALAVAMTVAPGLYSRNRFFDLHRRPEVRAARRRSALLRGALRHLERAVEPALTARGDGLFELTYRLPDVDFRRRVTVSGLEVACLRYLLGRQRRAPFGDTRDAPEGEDLRASVEAAIARLGPPPATRAAR